MKGKEVVKVTSDLIKKDGMTNYMVINDLIGEVNYIDRNRYILNISNDFVVVSMFDVEYGVKDIIHISDRKPKFVADIKGSTFDRIIQMLKKYHTLIDGLTLGGYLFLIHHNQYKKVGIRNERDNA